MNVEEELKTKEIPLIEVLKRIEIVGINDVEERANSRRKGLLLIPTRNNNGDLNILQIGFYKNELNENISTLEARFLDELLKEYGNFRNAIV
jgi:hypothetical protein